MEFISIFNDVLGPIMRGPSSSHTAGSFHIGTMARSLMKGEVKSVTFTFDPVDLLELRGIISAAQLEETEHYPALYCRTLKL